MSTFMTIPFLLLSLSVCNPCVQAAPAGVNPSSGDVETTSSTPPPTPSLGYESSTSSTMTMFFTPAVFKNDYYNPAPTSQPNAPAEDNVVSLDTEDVATPEPDVEATTLSQPSETFAGATESPSQANPAPETSAFPEPTAAPDYVPALESEPSAAASNVQPSLSTISLDASAFSTLVSELSTPSSSVSYSLQTPSHAATPLPPFPSDRSTSQSQTAQMTRKTAIIGTILALGSLLGISLCVICWRCRMPRSLRRSQSDVPAILVSDDTSDPEKAMPEKTSVSPTPSPQSSSVSLALPTLNLDAPSLSVTSDRSNDNDTDQWSAQRRSEPGWQTQAAMSSGASGFEDVTHLLSDDAFGPLPGSERSSTASDDSKASTTPVRGGKTRTSQGAASVTAESLVTCESSYSRPSMTSSRVSQAQSESDGASSSYLPMVPESSTPSPPDSPVLRTPTLPQTSDFIVTRSRSKTLTQPCSPPMSGKISSSKSFPEQYCDSIFDGENARVSVATRMTDGSEWDVAATYGARYSKASSVATSAFSDAPGSEIEEAQMDRENMETIAIGGRNCVLVQGYAF